MKEDMLKIVEHFGIYNQLKKLNEECYELIEAVRDYEDQYIKNDCDDEYLGYERKHIIEEIADLEVVLGQIIEYYKIDHKEINDIAIKKIDRTLVRISTGYYKK